MRSLTTACGRWGPAGAALQPSGCRRAADPVLATSGRQLQYFRLTYMRAAVGITPPAGNRTVRVAKPVTAVLVLDRRWVSPLFGWYRHPYGVPYSALPYWAAGHVGFTPPGCVSG